MNQVEESTTAPEADDDGTYFVSVTELARRCGLSKSSGFDMVDRDQVRTVRYGRRILVPMSEVRRIAALIDAGHDLGPAPKPDTVEAGG